MKSLAMGIGPAMLTAIAIPHVLALGADSAAMPVCVEQALNEFENGGPCNLGDKACYCSSSHKSLLLSDMNESCVNDSNAQASIGQYVSSFCGAVTGGGTTASTDTTSVTMLTLPTQPSPVSNPTATTGMPGSLPPATNTLNTPTTVVSSSASLQSSLVSAAVTTTTQLSTSSSALLTSATTATSTNGSASSAAKGILLPNRILLSAGVGLSGILVFCLI